jgi:hypothetical protein
VGEVDGGLEGEGLGGGGEKGGRGKKGVLMGGMSKRREEKRGEDGKE